MVAEYFNEDAYAEDMLVWQKLKQGQTYTVEELKDELNDDLTAYTALYPTGKGTGTTWADDLNTPTYDHAEEEIRLLPEDIDIVIDKLEQRDSRRKGVFGLLHETRPRDPHMFSRKRVDRYETYTVTVEDV